MPMPPPNIPKLLSRVINQIIFLEKRSVFQHGQVKLYPSEIHLMQLIHGGQAANATGMAKTLGVSKGAISQTISRLNKKGIIEKTKDPANKNELTAVFTARGREAIEAFEQRLASLRKPYAQYLAGLTSDERRVIERFLVKTQDMLGTLG